MTKDFKLYFDEVQHKYTDSFGNPYISVTTLIGQYKDGFETVKVAKLCEKIGKNPRHAKYLKYRDKSWKQLVKEWEKTKDDACDWGNDKHNYFEDAIKSANGYSRVEGSLIKGEILTVKDIVNNPNHGTLDLDYFRRSRIDILYPKIYKLIAGLVNKGFNIYAEIGVFHLDYLISGLIDVFFYNPQKGTFVIMDWKTNNAPMRYEAGFFEKDSAGNITDVFKQTDKKMNYPLHDLPASSGSTYNLQIDLYATLAADFGIINKGNVLCHIRHDMDENNLAVVDIHVLKDYKQYVKLMIEHYMIERSRVKNYQFKIV